MKSQKEQPDVSKDAKNSPSKRKFKSSNRDTADSFQNEIDFSFKDHPDNHSKESMNSLISKEFMKVRSSRKMPEQEPQKDSQKKKINFANFSEFKKMMGK